MSSRKTRASGETDTTASGAQTEKRARDVMYLGPTITGAVRHSTVFRGGILPDKTKECIGKLPMMEKLFVPLSDIPEAVKELNRPQSVLHTVYVQTAKEFL